MFLFALYVYGRDALEGFYKCSLCGFENFRRFVFCAVCGSCLRRPEGEVVVTRFETLVEKNRVEGHTRGFHKRDVIGTRQRRARCVTLNFANASRTINIAFPHN